MPIVDLFLNLPISLFPPAIEDALLNVDSQERLAKENC